ncbi:peptide ABC transporter substrate-binding protein [Paenibacillus sp. J31TS4]|uniref:ABC transporter substrate-binding protein n=1 Tax=Paenibacillus sp. J31TS4 TaxID=2807195 RepID=UPI001B27C900|nr:ABC transporter substrate-binding protein [Paenibacillus sp. J31TS4]GIP38497.1 peptide ABC transporter substrate-binding protein [Paenibacillus sp. J31TS4]
MKMMRHYMQLRHTYPQQPDGAELAVTLDELAEALACTHRNVVLVLKRMEERGWLEWKPRRGRGNRSGLVFRMPLETMAVEAAKLHVQRKDLKSALEQVSAPGLPPAARETFQDWLYGQFGYSREGTEQAGRDTLRFPWSQPIRTLDPLAIHLAAESHLVSQLFDGLVRRHPARQQIEPHLAHAWETDQSRTEWLFYLRKGVLFHHGRELRAEDVVYSLDRLRTSTDKLLYSWVYADILETRAVDATTVLVRLRQPNELFLPVLATNRASIVPEELCRGQEERFAEHPVGTGPFRLAEHDEAQCVLEAFPSYFQGRAHLDRVEIWKLPDLPSKDLERFQLIHNVRLPKASEAAWTQVKQQGTTCKFLTWNVLHNPLLQRHAVRRALAAAMDRGRLIERLAGDVIVPASGFLGRNAEEAPPPVPADAAEQLERAGYRGETLELCTIPQYEADARHVVAICAEAGIPVNVTLLPVERFKSDERFRCDLLLFTVLLDGDAELRLIDLYTSIRPHAPSSLAAWMDRELEAIRREPSAEARQERLLAIERELKEQEGIVFLYQKHLKTVYHPSVKGVSIDSLGWVQFKDIWFKPEATPSSSTSDVPVIR